jgi:hypothetical protein
MDIDAIRSRIAEHGLAFRGAFHPDAEDAPPFVSGSGVAGTIVLVGFVGSENWPAFSNAPEAKDGLPDPLDRWSLRVIGELAHAVGATACFPFGMPPFLPFQRWAQKAEPVHPSPLGILIHPDWGLWHAYRGALAFAARLSLPEPDRPVSPCDTCATKPCLSACPVGAFSAAGYDVPACIDHIAASAGIDCMDHGCRARRACPVGARYRYEADHAHFHLRAFLEAQWTARP